MKALIGSFLLLMALFTISAHAGVTATEWNGKILRAEDETVISFQELTEALATADNVMLGEKHYTPAVQSAQAAIIKATVMEQGRQGDFVTAWEFLNFTDANQTQHLFEMFVAGKITAQRFLDWTQGEGQGGSYAPILEVTKELGGEFIGVNVSRKERGKVARGGITAVDPSLLPPDFELGGPNYYERFADIMSGHVSQEKIANYYAAQCLTDDAMAYHLMQDSAKPLRFLILGSFHSDYLDGTVARVKARAPGLRTVTVRILDASDYTREELSGGFRHPKYGILADYIYFVNEPRN